MSGGETDATDLLRAMIERGDRSDPRLDPLVYDEVRALAQKLMRRERGSHTLQPTALANEAYLRLIDPERTSPEDRKHFLVLATRAMRRILIDHARARGTSKRGGGWGRVTLSDGPAPNDQAPSIDLLALEEALIELEALDERKAAIVELRFYAGLTTQETASYLGLSAGRVSQEWRVVRAWLGVRVGADE